MIFTVATLLLTFVCALSASADDLPPGVVDTQNPQDVSLSPEASLGRITVPDGFHVTLYAGEPDVRRPIAFDFDDRGRLWVVENYSHPNWRKEGASDRIVILEDTDHDGQFDRRKVFWDKGRYLTGIAIGHGGVWIANTPELAFLPDRDSDDVPDTDPVVILDGFQISTSNVLNNLHWGPDGWLYGAIGLSEPSRVGRPGTPQEKRTRITRGMWRCHPIRHDFEVLAEGMVNPWGADFNAYGDLFTVNTVIAHLWHIVPGMYCQRRGDEQDYPFAYGRIQSIANHLHWGGGRWQDSGTNADRHSVAGGGHAHCGAMIYLGDNWPKKYYGTLLTANLHGNRLNNDLLIPNQSTYVGAHADDFLFGNDPWFRGLSVKYGPDGGVYISDWHDLGECHDKDGSHRSSGRIYKVVYGRPEKRSVDLQRLSDGALAELHLHANAWFVRHARRILHERFHSGRDLVAARRRLREIFRGDRDEVRRLRALWTLYVIDDLDEPTLVRLLQHENHHVRRWAVRLLVDRHPPGSAALGAMAHLAREDASPEVRLALASSLHKLRLKDRWTIAEALAAHDAYARDPYLPLMIWYGVEPLVAEDGQAALILASAAKIPLLRRYIARRLLDVAEPAPEQVVRAALRTPDPHVRFDFLQGMLDALGDRGSRSPPPSWRALHDQITASSDPALRSVAVRLATMFGDRQAIARLQKNALDDTASPRERRESLRALLQVDGGVPVSMLHRLVKKQSVVRRDAIHALVLRNDPSTAKVLLDAYSDLDPAQQQDAISVLGTRRRFAAALLDAVEQGTVQRGDVSAYALQQLRSFHDPELQRRVGSLWADHADQLVKSDEIARYKRQMTREYLQRGKVGTGRLLFERTCAKCHMLFGEGGTIAPDLTGSGRRELDYLLSNLVDPSAIVDPVYRLTIIATSDGRVLSGFMIQQTERFVVLRTQEARVRLAMDDIEELQTSSKSMMPEGMLRGLSDEQVRDLLLYLSSPQQVPLPRSNDDP